MMQALQNVSVMVILISVLYFLSLNVEKHLEKKKQIKHSCGTIFSLLIHLKLSLILNIAWWFPFKSYI